MANFIAITLFAAVLQCAAQAAAQVASEPAAHNRVATHEQLSNAASLHQRARGNVNNGSHQRALEICTRQSDQPILCPGLLPP